MLHNIQSLVTLTAYRLHNRIIVRMKPKSKFRKTAEGLVEMTSVKRVLTRVLLTRAYN